MLVLTWVVHQGLRGLQGHSGMQTTEKVLPLFSSEVFFKKLTSLFQVVICGKEVENKQKISKKSGSENMRMAHGD